MVEAPKPAESKPSAWANQPNLSEASPRQSKPAEPKPTPAESQPGAEPRQTEPAIEQSNEEEEHEGCFRASVQVPRNKRRAMRKFDGAKIDIYVNGDRIPIEVQVKDYDGTYDYNFEVRFWGTGHLQQEDQEEVFKEMRRWLRNENIHVFWHKGLDTPKPDRQDVYMWFE